MRNGDRFRVIYQKTLGILDFPQCQMEQESLINDLKMIY